MSPIKLSKLYPAWTRYISNFNVHRWHFGTARALYITYRFIRSKLLGYPADITIEVASYCNLKCPMCIQAKSMTNIERENRLLKVDDFKKVIDDIKSFAVQVSLFYAGEPLLNKDLPEMIRYASKNSLLTYINTNGLLLDRPEYRKTILQSGISKIHISFDGATPETYRNYRVGADFNKIKDNIKNLIIERGSSPTPVIAIQMIATKKTLPEIEAYRDLAKYLGVDRAFFTTMYIDQYKNTPSISLLEDLPENTKYSRYRNVENNRAILKNNRSKKCDTDRTIYILTNGKVIHCCYDYEAEHSFGNAFETDIKQIWKSNQYTKWRNEKAKPMKLPLCHKSCTVGIPDQWITLYEKNS
jgi:radical SAM protein with 4Fe4S-binding SPASM domain